MQVKIGNEIYNVEITYKKIRNMYLRAGTDGTLRISCSRRTSEAQIREFILSKASWIANASKRQEKRSDRIRTGTDGTATWLGTEYPVQIVIGARAGMKFVNGNMVLTVKENTPEEIERVFYFFAAKKVAELVDERRGEWDQKICRAHRKQLPFISVRYMTSRWGSCTPAHSSIRMSSRLIHFPAECLEYVLLHEYAHILQNNHSADFWHVVETFMPSYRTYQALMK